MAHGDSGAANHGDRFWLPFLAGVATGAVGLALARAAWPRRGLDLRLIRGARDGGDIPPLVLVPGILGSSLRRPDGTEVWLNVRNALGHFDLSLPFRVPFSESRDDLIPGGLLGVDEVLPRLFGFTEYADLLELLKGAGFHRGDHESHPALAYHVFSYDWRRDLVESARRLHEYLEALAESRGDRTARFNVVGHSMGGLVARYYLRYGTAEPEPGAPVTWAGAQRIRNLVLVAPPNGGSIPSLDAILNGNRVGLSSTTLAAEVISRMPSIYQLLPPPSTFTLLDPKGRTLPLALQDVATWERFGWGPFSPFRRRATDPRNGDADREAYRGFLPAVLDRARAFHEALARRPEGPCPARIIVLGGDCLPTLARAVVSERSGVPPRFEPRNRAEAEAMFDAGDGRVTRASVLSSHLPQAEDSEIGCGIPEVAFAFFGSADHHGIYSEPTFQSILMRRLLRPSRRRAAAERPGLATAAL